MGRAARDRPRPRGGEGHGDHSARGSYDNRFDFPDPEHDPHRDTPDADEDPVDRVDEEYEWPHIEDDEDD